MPDKKLKWLLAGPGDIARTRVAPALTAAERSELVAICGSKRRTSAVEMAEKYPPLTPRYLILQGRGAIFISPCARA